MRKLLIFALITVLAGGAGAQNLSTAQIAKIGFDQKLGTQVPLELPFRDETGAPVQLRDYLGRRPVVLVLAYYECPNLCTLVLNGLVDGVRGIRLEPGRDFEIVVVSIQPGDRSELAARKKRTYTLRSGRPDTAHGWHFLTGDAGPITELAAAVGFGYSYEPQSRQFAHASGLMLLSPQGKVTRYLPGIEFAPKQLRLALVEASAGTIGSRADQILLLCFHYNPVTGRYGLIISRVIQVAGCSTVLLLGAVILRYSRRERRQPVCPL